MSGETCFKYVLIPPHTVTNYYILFSSLVLVFTQKPSGQATPYNEPRRLRGQRCCHVTACADAEPPLLSL